MQPITPPHGQPIREDAGTVFGPPAPSVSPFIRWLARPGDGTLRHTHETPRAVRRRLGLSPRQYRRQLRAATRQGGVALDRFLRAPVPTR